LVIPINYSGLTAVYAMFLDAHRGHGDTLLYPADGSESDLPVPVLSEFPSPPMPDGLYRMEDGKLSTYSPMLDGKADLVSEMIQRSVFDASAQSADDDDDEDAPEPYTGLSVVPGSGACTCRETSGDDPNCPVHPGEAPEDEASEPVADMPRGLMCICESEQTEVDPACPVHGWLGPENMH